MVAQEFIAEFPVAELIEHPDNPRRGNVDMIGESIEANGFYGAVVVQRSTNRIIVGNHRTRVATALGHETVPVLVLDVDDDQARRIMLADNRSNDVAGYDERTLADLLAQMDDLTGTGFRDHDLEVLLAKLDIEEQLLPDVPTTVAPPERRVSSGDIWQIGGCRLVCGDSREPSVFDVLMEGEPIHLAFTSPPYADRRKYDQSTEFRPIHPNRYVEWFQPVAENVKDRLAPDGSWIVNIRGGAGSGLDMETYVLDLVLAHVRQWGWHWASEYCWERIGVPKHAGRRFKNAFEMIYAFALNDWKWRPDNVRHYSSEVPMAKGPNSGPGDWTNRQGAGGTTGAIFHDNVKQGDLAYPSNRLPTFSMVGDHQALGHPAAFPPALPRFFILAYTDPGDAVVDPFAGSGSTLVAAASNQRAAYGIELSPAYCDIIVTRLEESTGEPAAKVGSIEVVVA